MLVIEKMLVLIILMLVGVLLVKIHILDEETSRKLAVIVINVANPALIINSSQTDHSVPGSELLTAVIVAMILYAVLILAAAVLPKIMKLKQEQANAYAIMIVFSNIGYMGIPLVSELLGASAMLYLSVFILFFNILIYTYGIMLLQRGVTASSVQQRFSAKKLFNPGVVASIIAVALYLLRTRLPELITVPLEYLSNLTAPIGMLIIGVALANVKLRELFTDYKLLIFSLVRLLVVPLVSCFILKHFIGGGELLGVCVVMMSTPVGSMTVMMAQQYGGDTELLSKGVTMTTLLCIVTIPLVFAVLL